jgi:hypothetical protein
MAQAGANIDTAAAGAWMNNPNVYSPYGSSTWVQNGDVEIDGKKVPRFQQNITLSAGQQKLLNQQEQLGAGMNDLALGQVTRLSGHLDKPMSLDHLPAMQTGQNINLPNKQFSAQAPDLMSNLSGVGNVQRSVGADDFGEDRLRVEQALYDRLNPQLDRDRASLESQLVNQGFQRGTTAFDTKMDEYNRSVNDARLAVTAAGGAEQSRLFGMDVQKGQFANAAQGQEFDQGLGRAGLAQQGFGNEMTRRQFDNDQGQADFTNQMNLAGFTNNARQAGLQETLAMRNQPINEITALMNGGQVSMPNFPSFNQQAVGNTPVGQYMYNSAGLNQANYNTQMQQNAATMGGMYGLGAAALKAAPGMISERRFKRDIVSLDRKTDAGFPLYSFKYVWSDEPQVGVMVEDVEPVMPEAIIDLGFAKAVNIEMVGL